MFKGRVKGSVKVKAENETKANGYDAHWTVHRPTAGAFTLVFTLMVNLE